MLMIYSYVFELTAFNIYYKFLIKRKELSFRENGKK